MGMLFQEVAHQRGFVGREVVEDDVNLLPGRAEGDDFLQEGNEVLTGVASGSLSVNPTGGRFQGRIEGERAVPAVLEAVTFGPAGRKRQYWIEPVQSLNRSLFSSTQKTAACSGGFRYRPILSAALLSKSGSSLAMYRSSRCGFKPASFQTRCTASLLTPSSAAPMRGTILRCSAGSRENPRPQFRSDHESRLPGMTGVESVDARSEETLLPSDGGRSSGSSFC
jgi:hypothetical protein